MNEGVEDKLYHLFIKKMEEQLQQRWNFFL